MKYNTLIITVLSLLSLFIAGCSNSDVISNKKCIEKGFVFKNAKVLNYRTGKYVMRNVCKKDK